MHIYKFLHINKNNSYNKDNNNNNNNKCKKIQFKINNQIFIHITRDY